MADEGYDRTFPGDPNPPPQAPKPAVAPQEPAIEETGAAPAAQPKAAPSRPAKAIFQVSADEDGRRSVYMMDDQFETTRLGPINVDNADDLLASVGEFNAKTGIWRVPEATAKQLLAGDMPIPDYVPAKYRANKAVIANGLIWTDWLRGKIDLSEAQGRGDLEALKMQIKEAPLFVWQGDIPKTVAKMWDDLKTAGPSGFVRRVAGETAGQAAFMTDAPIATAVGIGLLAPVVASKGAAAAAVVPAVAAILENGLVFKRSYEIEGGNAASEMIQKGFDEATVKRYAPLVGVMNGALETLGFHMVPAPYKRVIARKVLASVAVKKALSSAYVNYMRELGTEVTTEVAQEAVNVYAENMAAEVENKPELRVTGEQAINRYADIALKTLAGTAGVKVPGLGLEVAVQRADTKAEAKAAGEMSTKLEARKTAMAAEVVAPAPAGEAVAPAPAAEAPQSAAQAEFLQTLGVKVDEGTITPDEFVAQTDKAIEEAAGSTEVAGAPEVKQTFEQATRGVEVKARVDALTSDLADVRGLITEMEKTRERFTTNGLSTRLLDTKIGSLLDQENAIKADLTFYEAAGKEAAVGEHETLAMKPATLENIVRLGFKEGRKEVIAVRARQIKDLASKMGLTNADLRLLLKNKNFGTMGDVEFRHWMEGHERINPETKKPERVQGFRQTVAEHVKRKVAVKEVRRTLKDKQIRHEKNIRALHGLPPVGKMTTPQLWEYLDVLGSYDEDAVALTPTRIKALETTKLAGAKTMQDVLALAAKTLRKSVAELQASFKSQFDMMRGDTELAESQPVYAFMVDEVQTAEIEGDAKAQAFEQTNYRLGAAAMASRGGILRRLVPAMPEVMVHLEADPAQVYALQVVLPDLTPEEQTYVEFLRGAFQMARAYLKQTGELESTRFEQKYAPHTRRSAAEILVGIKDSGIKAAVGEFFDNVFALQKEIGDVESGGPALGLRKFFRQTLFRSGEMTPSTNVIKSTTSYFKQFFRKQALDKAIPTVDTVVEALRTLAADTSEDGQAAQKALGNFIKVYLNNKKGNNTSMDAFAPRGGVIDAAIRFVSGWISLAYIGGNAALQLTAPVGETLASVPVVGPGGVVKGNLRWARLMATEKGRAILKKYEYFTGKGFTEMALEPGKDITDRAGVALYGLLSAGRAHAVQVVLLASMTDAEFNAGEISAGRLADIKLLAGRWMDLSGMKSVLGSTSTGAAVTKFRGWMLPILRTTVQDIGSAINSMGAKIPGTHPLTVQQKAELLRVLGVTVAVTGLAAAMGEVDKDDDSFVAKFKRKLLSEMFSLTQVFDPKMMLTAGPWVAFMTQLGTNLSLLYHLETYKTGEKEGELKGPDALAKQMPFGAAVRNFTPRTER